VLSSNSRRRDPPPRWSKRTDELVRGVAHGLRPSLQSELGEWIHSNARFADFVSANQDKIRKKLSIADAEARLDVRAELVVAHALLGDRRFALRFEAYGAGQIGPDFTVTFRANQEFNLEITRLRTASEPDVVVGRLANVIAGKLRQLRNDRPNALAIATPSLATTDEAVGNALRLLKSHSDTRDDEFFAHRGLKTAREFYAQYLHLSGVFLLDESNAVFVANREARRPLASDIVTATTACLGASAPA
jgi:hypothetical protein